MSAEHEQPIQFPESSNNDLEKTFQPSKEEFEKSVQVDSIIKDLFQKETIDYSQVLSFLASTNKPVRVLSDTPDHLIDMLKSAGLALTVIPVSQQEHEAFQKDKSTRSDSDVPDWFRDAQEQLKNEKKSRQTDILNELNERKFLIAMLLLGGAAIIGFGQEWAIKLPELFSTIDMYLSIYGGIAVSRSIWQMTRAERWNATARKETRHHYADALGAITPESSFDYPVIQELLLKAKKITKKSSNLDTFLHDFGLMEKKKKRKNSKPSLLEEYQAALGEEFDREKITTELSQHIIEQQFGEKPPSIAIVIPTYQTTEEEMQRLLRSIKQQVYPVTNVYVVYNDDPNDPLRLEKKQPEFFKLQKIVDSVNTEPGRNNCHIQLFAQPARGKREAMAMGFATALGKDFVADLQKKYPNASEDELSKAIGNLDLRELPDFRHEYVLNIDSDTEILDPFSVLSSLNLMKAHPNAATTTGDVRVTNREANLLSEMTYQRYWRAFFVERAAQSLDGNVTCMSGPWVCMRSEALASIFEEWYFQEFLGVRTTYGDDRHLSTLFLRDGWDSLFNPDSAVLTDCPIDWKVFLRQQLRWNKSFNRENFILFRYLHKLDKFTQMDVLYQQSFAVVMLAIIAQVLWKAGVTGVQESPIEGATSLVPYGVSILLYNLIFFGGYGIYKNNDPKYIYSPVYIWYHFKDLLRLKVLAILERKDQGWGTKGETPVIPANIIEEVVAEIDGVIQEQVARMEAEIEAAPEENNKQLDTSNPDQEGESL